MKIRKKEEKTSKLYWPEQKKKRKENDKLEKEKKERKWIERIVLRPNMNHLPFKDCVRES